MEHYNRNLRLVQTTCENIRAGTYADPKRIVDGIRQELQQGVDFNWFSSEQRDEMVRWLEDALLSFTQFLRKS